MIPAGSTRVLLAVTAVAIALIRPVALSEAVDVEVNP